MKEGPLPSARKRVHRLPEKAHVIFDGDCGFCRYWIGRWQGQTGSSVIYLPAADPSVARDFPELTPEEFAGAVYLIETDGQVYYGAEAVFQLLSRHGSSRWPLSVYLRIPAARWISEEVYQFVARHRPAFSFLTRALWGRETGPSAYAAVSWLFLRALGAIYLIAFLSLWIQASGLLGSQGIAPLGQTLPGVQEQLDTSGFLGRFLQYPTLFWLGPSDQALHFICLLGVALAFCLLLNVLSAIALPLLWLFYLSLTTAGNEFMAFQWDALLLETGFLAIFLAPWRGRFFLISQPSLVMVWLFRWLLFRLMFESGYVKLLSGDETWRHLTALQYHYETQPLPTWIGYFAHQLPGTAQMFSTCVMFAIELICPLLVFTPRRLRMAAAFAFILLQVAILLTGNYCFFNLLTMALCLFLCDDAALIAIFPRAITRRWLPTKSLSLFWQWSPIRTWVCAIIALPILIISLIDLGQMFRLWKRLPRPLLAFYGAAAPFRSVNHYGLFAVMTTDRPELVIEGSNDGQKWLPYEFKFKPGSLTRRPGFVAPHQPRLDWQMWFAALGSYRQNPWLIRFCVRLLEGSEPVLRLLKKNPFPGEPPRYIRVQIYRYHFTDWGTLRSEGAWWRRTLPGEYLPVISLQRKSRPDGEPQPAN